MRLFIRVATWFYLFIILTVGFSMLLMLAHFTDFKTLQSLMKYLYDDPKASMATALVTGAVMFISVLIASIIWGRQERERTIFIDNPLGRVSISLSALEDMIRRLVTQVPQVKEIRPSVISSKKGLKVDIRLVLYSHGNIPALTTELQDLITRRIQNLIGREEKIHAIRIHVIKIAGDALKGKKGRDADFDDIQESPLHFHGYRA